jgi:hypothetical protein
MYHVRRGPDMVVDQSVAPYVTGQAATYGMLSAGGHALTADEVAMYQLQLTQDQTADSQNAEIQSGPTSAPCDNYQRRSPCTDDAPDEPPAPVEAPEAPPAEGDTDDEEVEFLLNHLEQLQSAVKELAAERRSGSSQQANPVSRRAPSKPRSLSPAQMEQLRAEFAQQLAAQQSQFEARYAAKCREVELLRQQNGDQTPDRPMRTLRPSAGDHSPGLQPIRHVETTHTASQIVHADQTPAWTNQLKPLAENGDVAESEPSEQATTSPAQPGSSRDAAIGATHRSTAVGPDSRAQSGSSKTSAPTRKRSLLDRLIPSFGRSD